MTQFVRMEPAGSSAATTAVFHHVGLALPTRRTVPLGERNTSSSAGRPAIASVSMSRIDAGIGTERLLWPFGFFHTRPPFVSTTVR